MLGCRRTGEVAVFSEILVPFNGSDDTIRALEIGGGLASASSRPLRILAYSNDLDVPIHSRALHDMADKIGERYGLSAQITTVVSARYLADELLAEAHRRTGSVLCIPSEGLGRRALFTGSMALDVLTAAPGPVVLVGPHCEERMFEHSGPLVVALDGSPQSEAIVEIAHEWATSFHLPVEVVTVLEPDQAGALASAIAGGDVQESAYVAHVAEASVLSEGEVSFEILHGKPVEEILREANLKDASMIAIASTLPLGMDRLLHGSVLDEVVRHSPVPVLAVNQSPAAEHVTN
jgi:nucleotide-binding universal stress UspA family protein